MRFFITISILLFLTHTCMGQQTGADLKRVGAKKVQSLDSAGWAHTGLFLFNVNQSAQSAWVSGGEKFIIGINTVVNYSLHHRYGGYTLDSYADLELGAVEAASFEAPRKTSDRCDITVEFEHDIKKSAFNYAALFNFNSQIFPGKSYSQPGFPKTTNFMSPGKILLSLGVDFKDYDSSHYFSLIVSPVTFRLVTKLDKDFYHQDKFGVDSSSTVYLEVGPFVTMHYNANFSKKVKYIGRLDFYSNYRRDFMNVDVLMNNLLTFEFSKRFAGSILLDIIYDDNVKKELQVQQMFGVGLKFKL